jgi:hypothetical protein
MPRCCDAGNVEGHDHLVAVDVVEGRGGRDFLMLVMPRCCDAGNVEGHDHLVALNAIGRHDGLPSRRLAEP